MKLSELVKTVKNSKRLGKGRASGWGKTSGRGTKGQKARSGGAKGPYFEGGQTPLIRRVPKRGFRNIFRKEVVVVNVGTLDENFSEGEEVSIQSLREKKIVRRKLPVKILGKGEVTKCLTVRVDKFSKTAREKIAKAGGITEEIG
ncbi:MAG: 50S ribosomal protein L15 [Deltaproteobacteria bacterium]|nr:50S ribosomal protein L15 [Deltaproteobacteria bacterium]